MKNEHLLALFVKVMSIEAQVKTLSEVILDKAQIDSFNRKVGENLINSYKKLQENSPELFV